MAIKLGSKRINKEINNEKELTKEIVKNKDIDHVFISNIINSDQFNDLVLDEFNLINTTHQISKYNKELSLNNSRFFMHEIKILYLNEVDNVNEQYFAIVSGSRFFHASGGQEKDSGSLIINLQSKNIKFDILDNLEPNEFLTEFNIKTNIRNDVIKIVNSSSKKESISILLLSTKERLKHKDMKFTSIKALEKIDWLRRINLSRMHSAEHIFMSSILKIFENQKKEIPESKNMNLSRDKVSIHENHAEIFINTNLKKEELIKILNKAENLANRIVLENYEIEQRILSKKDFENDELNKITRISLDKIRSKTIRLVIIKKSNNIFDVSACKGTHVKNTSVIGRIFWYGLRRYKKGYVIKISHSLTKLLELKNNYVDISLKLGMEKEQLFKAYQNLQEQNTKISSQLKKLSKLLPLIAKKFKIKNKEFLVIKLKDFETKSLLSIAREHENIIILNYFNGKCNVIAKNIELPIQGINYKGKIGKDSFLFIEEKDGFKLEKRLFYRTIDFSI